MISVFAYPRVVPSADGGAMASANLTEAAAVRMVAASINGPHPGSPPVITQDPHIRSGNGDRRGKDRGKGLLPDLLCLAVSE